MFLVKSNEKSYIISISLGHLMNNFYIGLIPIISFFYHQKVNLSYKKIDLNNYYLFILAGFASSLISRALVIKIRNPIPHREN